MNKTFIVAMIFLTALALEGCGDAKCYRCEHVHPSRETVSFKERFREPKEYSNLWYRHSKVCWDVCKTCYDESKSICVAEINKHNDPDIIRARKQAEIIGTKISPPKSDNYIRPDENISPAKCTLSIREQNALIKSQLTHPNTYRRKMIGSSDNVVYFTAKNGLGQIVEMKAYFGKDNLLSVKEI